MRYIEHTTFVQDDNGNHVNILIILSIKKYTNNKNTRRNPCEFVNRYE